MRLRYVIEGSKERQQRSTVVWERPDGVPNMCVRSAWPGQLIRFESSAAHGLGLLDPFATQSNKSNIIMINLDVGLKFYHDWIGLVAYTYSLLLFSKRKPEPYKTLHSLDRWAKYTR